MPNPRIAPFAVTETFRPSRKDNIAGRLSEVARAKESEVATLDEFLEAVDSVNVKEFKLKSIGKVVKIAPASLVESHRIYADLNVLQENPNDAEARAAWQVAWIVACMVEPVLTTQDARKLIESRNPDIIDLATACQEISGFGLLSERQAAEDAADIETAEEVPGAAPLE